MVNFIRQLLFTTSMVIIASCGVINDKHNDNEIKTNQLGSITIDSAGLVPVLGSNATTTAIFIHNNSNEIINNITYEATNVVAKKSKLNLLRLGFNEDIVEGLVIDRASANLCSRIVAHGKCALKFTTPAFSSSNNQGSGVISLRYGDNNSFSQVINYQQIEPKDGLNITSGVNMNSYGYDNSYATVYIYSGNQSNKVDRLSLNKPAFSIIDNNITGNELASLQVQAVEISAPSNIMASMEAILSVKTDLGQMSTMTLTALPNNSGAVLVSGLLPNYDLNGKLSITGSSYVVTNLGNESAVIGSITSNSNAITIVGGANQCQDSVLAIGASCTVYFNIVAMNESQRINGSGMINVAYSSAITGGNLGLSNIVNWGNSQVGGLANIVVNGPINFVQNDGSYGVNESFNVTVTNIGGVNLTNITFNVRSITGRLSVESVSNCSNLNIGSSCIINIRVSDAVVENNKQLVITLNASAGSFGYTRSNYLIYNTITNKPLFVLQALPNTYQIFGNGKESQTGVIMVSNNGATTTSSGRITASNFSQFGNFFTVDLGTSKCQINQILNVGESCIVGIKLNAKNESIALGENGVAVYRLGTIGINMGESAVNTVNIAFNILPNNQSFKITSVSLVDSDSGDGETEATKFILGGEKIASQLLITYQNESTNTVKVLGAYEPSTSGIFWRLESFSVRDVAPGESFTLSYTNILGSIQANYLTNTLVSPVENVMLPTIYFQDYTNGVVKPTQFVQKVLYKGNQYIYVEGRLGTLINTVTVNNPGLITESYTLATAFNTNTRNYTNTMTVNIFTDIVGNTLLGTSNCSSSELDAITQITCNLSASNWTGSATYLVNSNYIVESDLVFNAYYNRYGYEINTGGRAIVVDKVYSKVKLPTIAVIWTKQVGGNSNEMTYGNAGVSDNLGNIYITGSTQSSLSGETKQGNSDYFLAKYNLDGNLLWSKQVGAAGGIVSAEGVATDSNNNIYISGKTNVGISGESKHGTTDYFIAKYNSSGTLLWTRQFGGDGRGITMSKSITIDNNNNIYISGQTSEPLFGESMKGIWDCFIARYDVNGNLIWYKQIGGQPLGQVVGYWLNTDSIGNVYITGRTAVGLFGESQKGIWDYFLIKYDNNGNLLWNKQVGQSGSNAYGYGVATDTNNNIYVTGYIDTGVFGESLKGIKDCFLTKYSESGNFIWHKQFGGTGGDVGCYDITTDSNNNIYGTGYTNVGLLGNSLTGIYDYFVVKYNSNGSLSSLKQFGAVSGNIMSSSIIVNSSIYVIGDTTAGLFDQIQQGSSDYFISKLKLF